MAQWKLYLGTDCSINQRKSHKTLPTFQKHREYIKINQSHVYVRLSLVLIPVAMKSVCTDICAGVSIPQQCAAKKNREPNSASCQTIIHAKNRAVSARIERQLIGEAAARLARRVKAEEEDAVAAAVAAALNQLRIYIPYTHAPAPRLEKTRSASSHSHTATICRRLIHSPIHTLSYTKTARAAALRGSLTADKY